MTLLSQLFPVAVVSGGAARLASGDPGEVALALAARYGVTTVEALCGVDVEALGCDADHEGLEVESRRFAASVEGVPWAAGGARAGVDANEDGVGVGVGDGWLPSARLERFVRHDVARAVLGRADEGRSASRVRIEEALLGMRALGCPPLDGAMGGGAKVGQVTEVCGGAATGKTQVCLQACAVALEQGFAVAYVDCGGGGFSGLRLTQVLRYRLLAREKRRVATEAEARAAARPAEGVRLALTRCLEKVRVFRVWSAAELVQRVQALAQARALAARGALGGGDGSFAAALGLVVVDGVANVLMPVASLPALGPHSSAPVGEVLLSGLVQALRAAARTHDVADAARPPRAAAAAGVGGEEDAFEEDDMSGCAVLVTNAAVPEGDEGQAVKAALGPLWVPAAHKRVVLVRATGPGADAAGVVGCTARVTRACDGIVWPELGDVGFVVSKYGCHAPVVVPDADQA